MYCPYCKNTMQLKDGVFYCKTGNNFSKVMGDFFLDKVGGLKVRDFKKSNCDNYEDGKFFCINCGEKMKKVEDMHEVCSSCGFEIDRTSYFRLIELNPHTK